MVAVFNSEDASRLAYLCLYALQHRGQEGSGISVSGDNGIASHKGEGLVYDIYDEAVLSDLKGNYAVGNNKYSTIRDRHVRSVLPIVGDLFFGELAVCLTGFLDIKDIKEKLVKDGAIFTTSTDSEVVMHLIARKASKMNLEESIMETFKGIKGSYCATFMAKDKIIVVRDPHGFKPLLLGQLQETYIVASETPAFDLIGAKFIREIMPGEVFVFDSKGGHTFGFIDNTTPALCIFEYVYMARPDSILAERCVYKTRLEMGRSLAREARVKADVVIPVPDSGVASALGYSHESGIPFELGIVRNHYVGRTFIKPSNAIRNFSIKVKLNPIESIIRGKSLVVIDDSIVRGNTSKQIVFMLKEAGAKEVHFRVASPPVAYPCLYGMDTPYKEDLIFNKYNKEQIRDFIGADSLEFLSVENLAKSVGNGNFCKACFDGKYPLIYNGDEL